VTELLSGQELVKSNRQEAYTLRWQDLVNSTQEEAYKSRLSFSLPTAQSEVLDIHFVQNKFEDEHDEDIIQILAMDYKNKVLVIATWDVRLDQEIHMHQIVCDEKYPKSLFLHGICDLREINKNEEKFSVSQGANNYLLQGDLIVDLKNSVPYMYSTIKQKQTQKYIENYRNNVPYIKKIYRDTSRFLSVSKPHHLIFDHCLKDIQYVNDVIKNPEPTDVLRRLESVLPLFRLKFKGQSLFHYFAANMDIEGVISLVFEQYMMAKESNNFHEESIKLMPLLILSPDDEKMLGALEIAIMQKKPQTFEKMVAMLRDFSDICSSKMMLSNF
jgi:hypothetical protein